MIDDLKGRVVCMTRGISKFIDSDEFKYLRSMHDDTHILSVTDGTVNAQLTEGKVYDNTMFVLTHNIVADLTAVLLNHRGSDCTVIFASHNALPPTDIQKSLMNASIISGDLMGHCIDKEDPCSEIWTLRVKNYIYGDFEEFLNSDQVIDELDGKMAYYMSLDGRTELMRVVNEEPVSSDESVDMVDVRSIDSMVLTL